MGTVLCTLGFYAFFKSFPIDFFTVASCFNKGDIHDHVLLQILVFGVMDLALVIGFRPWGHFVMGSCHPLFIGVEILDRCSLHLSVGNEQARIKIPAT